MVAVDPLDQRRPRLAFHQVVVTSLNSLPSRSILSCKAEIDSAARVLVPPELRSWAGLEKDVKFMGVGAHFELWDMARYEAREAEVIARGRPEALRTLVIR